MTRQTIIDDFIIPAGGQVKLSIPGKYFRVMETTKPLNVYMRRRGSIIGKLLGVGSGDGVGPVKDGYHGVDIETEDGTGLVVRLALGDDPFMMGDLTGSVSVSGGTVNTLAIGSANPLSQNVFSSGESVTAAPAALSYVQLLNPVASGKQLRVLRSSCGVYIGSGLVYFMTLTGQVPGTSLNPKTVANHYSGGAVAAVGRVYLGTAAANYGTNHFGDHWCDATMGEKEVVIPEAPIIIPEGESILFRTAVVNEYLLANFTWEEF